MKQSQEDFAEKAEVHRTYISSVELGKVSVGIEVANKLAIALNMKRVSSRGRVSYFKMPAVVIS
jgi:transcriptional regulator with XRE-family HTH domain